MSDDLKFPTIVSAKMKQEKMKQLPKMTTITPASKPSVATVTPKRSVVKSSSEEEEPKTCPQKFAAKAKAAYKSLGLQGHLVFTLALLAYAIVGGVIFHLIEGPVEIEQEAQLLKQLEGEAKNLTRKLQAANYSNSLEIYKIIQEYQRTSGLLPSKEKLEKKYWDFWGSMFYAGTLFTTIGYGHYAPQSNLGRVATMCYAVIGIPLVLATLADMGRLMTKMFKKLWTYCCRCCLRCLNHFRWTNRDRDNVKNGDEIATEEFDLPVPVALMLLAAWIFLCSSIFCIWEDWSYFTAYYFFFVSLSTIGLGDVTPDHPKYLICCFPLVIMGLSLVSMVINLIQNKIEAVKEITAEYIEEEFGLETESSSSEDEEGGVSGHRNQDLQPTSLGIIQTWSKAAELRPSSENLKATIQTWRKKARRKRRGIQTEASFLRDLKQRFPHLPYSEIPNDVMVKSKDDINSLIEALDLC